MEIVWLLIVSQAVICAFLSMNLADHKGHSSGAWFAAGFFLGILGLIAAVGLPNKVAPSTAALLHKKCPDCAETIRIEAFICKFCGKKFSKDQILDDLAGCLQDNSMAHVTQALILLRPIKDSSLVPSLLKLVEKLRLSDQNDPQYKVLNEALQLLTQIPSPTILPDLASIARNTASTIKANRLLEILGSVRDPSSIPLLVDSLKSSERRDMAAKALEKIGQAALPGLEQILKDGKRSERNLAEQIISKIKQSSKK